MSTLYELTNIARQIADIADGDEELMKDSLEAIDFNEQYEKKSDGYAMVIKGLEATIKARKEEIQRLQQMNQSDENKKTRLKDSLSESMKLTGHTKFKTPLFNFRFQNNPISLKITDESLLDSQWFKVNIEPDKALIKGALKNGEVIDGAELVQTESLRF